MTDRIDIAADRRRAGGTATPTQCREGWLRALDELEAAWRVAGDRAVALLDAQVDRDAAIARVEQAEARWAELDSVVSSDQTQDYDAVVRAEEKAAAARRALEDMAVDVLAWVGSDRSIRAALAVRMFDKYPLDRERVERRLRDAE